VGRGGQARSKSRGFKDPQESPSVQVLVLGVKKKDLDVAVLPLSKNVEAEF